MAPVFQIKCINEACLFSAREGEGEILSSLYNVHLMFVEIRVNEYIARRR